MIISLIYVSYLMGMAQTHAISVKKNKVIYYNKLPDAYIHMDGNSDMQNTNQI